LLVVSLAGLSYSWPVVASPHWMARSLTEGIGIRDDRLVGGWGCLPLRDLSGRSSSLLSAAGSGGAMFCCLSCGVEAIPPGMVGVLDSGVKGERDDVSPP
jgi:hypothetical protein